MCIDTVGGRVDTVSECVLIRSGVVSARYREVYRGRVDTVSGGVSTQSGVYQHSIGKCIHMVGGRVGTVSECVLIRSGVVSARYRNVY